MIFGPLVAQNNIGGSEEGTKGCQMASCQLAKCQLVNCREGIESKSNYSKMG